MGATIADLCGDVPVVMGVEADASSPGLRQWLAAAPTVSANGLSRLMVDVMPGLRLLPRGPLAVRSPDVEVQAGRLRESHVGQPLIVDAGVVGPERQVAAVLEKAATTSILVIRPCYLAVKRVAELEHRADGFVLVEESGRCFDARDISDALGVEHLATLRWDPTVARAVDAGRTKSRPPRAAKALVQLAESLCESEIIEHAV